MSTALSTAWKYRQVIMSAAKALKFAADRINESTPQEREELGRHMRAIYEILRSAAKRKGEDIDRQQLSVFALPPAQGRTQTSTSRNRRIRRIRESISQLLNTLKKYRLHLTRVELAEISDHLKEIKRLASDIDRRVRVP